mmetsp:Transcript_13373/g.35922  ORF Transcript_13373/g.35922 Transcript_13373/m.35922 type:complete len:211 (-) Transcript_13373:347-979(-)
MCCSDCTSVLYALGPEGHPDFSKWHRKGILRATDIDLRRSRVEGGEQHVHSAPCCARPFVMLSPRAGAATRPHSRHQHAPQADEGPALEFVCLAGWLAACAVACQGTSVSSAHTPPWRRSNEHAHRTVETSGTGHLGFSHTQPTAIVQCPRGRPAQNLHHPVCRRLRGKPACHANSACGRWLRVCGPNFGLRARPATEPGRRHWQTHRIP